MISRKTLEEAGYRKYTSHKGPDTVLFQKQIYDSRIPAGYTTPPDKNLLLYSINFYEWTFENKVTWEVEAHLYTAKSEEFWISLSLHCIEKKDTEFVEDFFRQAFRCLDCCPDIHNN